jgi:hypothetical protein
MRPALRLPGTAAAARRDVRRKICRLLSANVAFCRLLSGSPPAEGFWAKAAVRWGTVSVPPYIGFYRLVPPFIASQRKFFLRRKGRWFRFKAPKWHIGGCLVRFCSVYGRDSFAKGGMLGAERGRCDVGHAEAWTPNGCTPSVAGSNGPVSDGSVRLNTGKYAYSETFFTTMESLTPRQGGIDGSTRALALDGSKYYSFRLAGRRRRPKSGFNLMERQLCECDS